jgi:hypothetical protein
MGGDGSGKQGTRSAVEDCPSVDANVYARWKFLRPGGRWGIVRWTRGKQEIGSCGVLTWIDDDLAVCVFFFNGRKVVVPLLWYAPGYGGRRYFFQCPACQRRMRTLRFSRGEIACRLCHNLTYQGCNESHSRDRLFMLMAAGDKRHTWKDYKRAANYYIRIANKEPKRPRGRPRKNDQTH